MARPTGRQREQPLDNVDAQRSRLNARKTYADDFRIRKAYGRNGCRLEDLSVTGNDFRNHHALRAGLMRQHGLTDQIAYGPDIVHGRMATPIDFDKSPV